MRGPTRRAHRRALSCLPSVGFSAALPSCIVPRTTTPICQPRHTTISSLMSLPCSRSLVSQRLEQIKAAHADRIASHNVHYLTLLRYLRGQPNERRRRGGSEEARAGARRRAPAMHGAGARGWEPVTVDRRLRCLSPCVLTSCVCCWCWFARAPGYKDDPKPVEKSIDMLGKMLVRALGDTTPLVAAAAAAPRRVAYWLWTNATDFVLPPVPSPLLFVLCSPLLPQTWREEEKVDEIVATRLAREEEFKKIWPSGTHGFGMSHQGEEDQGQRGESAVPHPYCNQLTRCFACASASALQARTAT